MSEIYIPLPSKDNLNLYLHQGFDGFFVGINGYSSNFNNYVEEKELDSVIDELNKTNRKIYICFNRLYYDHEIDSVKTLLEKVVKLDITGICYTDVGVLNILQDLKYNKEILWVSNHLGTNSKTINFLEKRGVTSVLLSSEITIDEVINIKKNTNISIGLQWLLKKKILISLQVKY